MRENLLAYRRGLLAFLREDESDEALAAGCNVAELLVMWRQSMTEGKKG